MTVPQKIAGDTVVTMHYRLTGSDGVLIDSSEADDPLTYLHGHENIVPGLEAQLEGHGTGDHVVAHVSAKDGYGLHDPQRMLEVPREQLDFDPSPGAIVSAQTEDGMSVMLKIIQVTDEHVLLDGNHPLAGQDLHFEVDVVSVRESTEEERAHGHVHGPEHHQ